MRQSQPEFIFPEGASKQRGRFELSFSQIGSSVMVGAGIGGTAGLYNGIRATQISGETGVLRRTQLLNHLMKQGSATANTMGTIAVLYAGFGCLLSFARGEDDEINTITAGTLTGLMYKSTAGLRKCAIGGGVGLALSSLWVLYNVAGSKRDSGFKQYV
jgi:mitochondrial import inner membrane translocase subunit TIM23